MSLTNICSCALVKDHQMSQIINYLYQLFLRMMNLASFCLRTDILIYFFEEFETVPPLPPPPSYMENIGSPPPPPRLMTGISIGIRPRGRGGGQLFSTPPAGRQRSFSHAASSIVRHLSSPSTFHLKY